ncbi:MAG: GNAT family N-acetyltransferase [Chloroflexota bacterium]|nr:GNAT family N-acetyltransferase [Chloroflexota bacterium]
MTTIDILPGRFLVRSPQMDDLEAVLAVINACDLADDGMLDHTIDELRTFWQSPDFNLDTDAWLVSTPEGRVIATADVDRHHVRIYSFIRVHPNYRGQGIEPELLRLTEARARQLVNLAPSHARVALGNWISPVDNTTRQLLEQSGYSLARKFWRMEMAIDQASTLPIWPTGITVHTLVAGKEERAVYEMMEEAFQDHWGHLPSTYEEFEHWHIKQDSFDPTLWFLAFDGDQLAGGILCEYQKDLDLGWVGQLAVRRPWRRKGLGNALLLHAFAEFYRRGIHKVGLGVDSQNLTGATRLYEKVGMHVALEHNTYEKELRAGEELSTQSVTM